MDKLLKISSDLWNLFRFVFCDCTDVAAVKSLGLGSKGAGPGFRHLPAEGTEVSR